MTKPESKKSSVASPVKSSSVAGDQVNNGSVEPSHTPQIRASVMRQTSRESLHRKNTECEVYDDGTNTFFW